MANGIKGLDWSGVGRQAAVARADAELAWFRKFTSAMNALKTALVNGGNAIAPNCETLLRDTSFWEGTKFAVADDWKVTDTLNYDELLSEVEPGSAAETTIENARRARANQAETATVQLQNLAEQVGVDVKNYANGISTARQEITAMTPIVAGMTSQRGHSDATALANGTATPVQLARLAAADTLTPEQLVALQSGNLANLSDGQFNYLMNMMRGLDGVSTGDLDNLQLQFPPHLRGSLPEAIALMGSPDVKNQSGSQRGGIEAVPSEVRGLITMANPTSTSTGAPTAPKKVSINRANELIEFAEFMQTGSEEKMAVGSDVSRNMYRLSAGIADTSGEIAELPGLRTWDRDADPRGVVESLMAAAENDHPAIADALSGSLDDDAAMNAASGHAVAKAWDSQSALDDLISLDSRDSSGAVKSLIESIDENSTHSNRGIAAESGRAAQGLTDHFARNPYLASESVKESAASLLGKYVPEMVGVNDQYLETAGFRSLSSQELANVFAAMDEYESSAVQFNQGAYASVTQLNELAGQMIADGRFEEAATIGAWSGAIDQAAREGMEQYLSDRGEGLAGGNSGKKSVFNSVRTGFGLVVEQIPIIGGVLGAGIDISGPLLTQELFSTAPEAASTAEIGINGTRALNYYQILSGIADHPDLDILGDERLSEYVIVGNDGLLRLMTFEELGRIKVGDPPISDPGTVYPEFSTAARHVVRDLGFNLGEYDDSYNDSLRGIRADPSEGEGGGGG